MALKGKSYAIHSFIWKKEIYVIMVIVLKIHQTKNNLEFMYS